MNKSPTKEMSKRQILREQRARQQRQQRLWTVLGIAVVAIVIVGLLIWPAIQQASQPYGDIVKITPQTDLPQTDGTHMGDPNAAITIEVFSDFQCPSCKVFAEGTEVAVIDEFVRTGQAQLIFRHFPFIDDYVTTKESDQAANASMCASEQGRFWDYHDIVYANWQSENKGAFNDERLEAFAKSLGLDMTQWSACFVENKFNDSIQADFQLGEERTINATPSIFVNGKQVVNQNPNVVPNIDDIRQAVLAASTGG